MVIRRRRVLTGLTAVLAALVAAGYLWRLSSDGGLVPFLLAGVLLVVAVVHAVAWQGSRSPLLIVDLTGLRVRLGGAWTGLPWAEIEALEVTGRGRFGDGRVVVWARDEHRALAEAGLRARFAILVNRWLYDAPLAVPYGLTATPSAVDIVDTLERLADGRVPVVRAESPNEEPDPTVEVAAAGTLTREDRPASDGFDEAAPAGAETPTPDPIPPRPSSGPPRRLAAVVSALRLQAGRLGEVTVPIRKPPVTVGTLALSEALDEETEPLPELQELRRRAPEAESAADVPRATVQPADDVLAYDEHALPDGAAAAVARVDTVSSPTQDATRTTNVELIIDATTDLSAQAMRRVRRPFDSAAEVAIASAGDGSSEPVFATTPGEVIGDELRRAREWLSMSVDDLAERTRIRPFVIESIEAGDFAACGGDFYARGHLRMLSAVLGIDAAPLVASYDAHLASAPVSPRAVFDAEIATGVGRPKGGGGSRWGMLIGAVLTLLLVWGVARVFLTDPSLGSTPGHTPSTNHAGLGSPGAGNTIAPPPVIPPAQVTLAARAASSRVVVWDASNTVLFQGVLAPGAHRTVSGQGPLRIMAVDGGAVAMTAKGHPKAPMGPQGQRVFRHVR